MTAADIERLVGRRVRVTVSIRPPLGLSPTFTGRILGPPVRDALRDCHLFRFQRDDRNAPGQLRVEDLSEVVEATGAGR